MLDTLLCCLVPVFLGAIFAQMAVFKQWWDQTGYAKFMALIFGDPVRPSCDPPFRTVGCLI
jgi:hypothetical protein